MFTGGNTKNLQLGLALQSPKSATTVIHDQLFVPRSLPNLMKNTDDIDREIKKIQLQREQLSLKRELAKENLKQSLLELPIAGGKLIGRVLFNLKVLVVGQWKPIVGIALVASTATGINAWLEYRAREEQRIASERFNRELNAHVEKKCGKFCSTGGEMGDFISFDGGPCIQALLPHGWCKMEAESNFRISRLQH